MTKQPNILSSRRGCSARAEGLDPASLRPVHAARLLAFDGPRPGP